MIHYLSYFSSRIVYVWVVKSIVFKIISRHLFAGNINRLEEVSSRTEKLYVGLRFASFYIFIWQLVFSIKRIEFWSVSPHLPLSLDDREYSVHMVLLRQKRILKSALLHPSQFLHITSESLSKLIETFVLRMQLRDVGLEGDRKQSIGRLWEKHFI